MWTESHLCFLSSLHHLQHRKLKRVQMFKNNSQLWYKAIKQRNRFIWHLLVYNLHKKVCKYFRNYKSNNFVKIHSKCLLFHKKYRKLIYKYQIRFFKCSIIFLVKRKKHIFIQSIYNFGTFDVYNCNKYQNLHILLIHKLHKNTSET